MTLDHKTLEWRFHPEKDESPFPWHLWERGSIRFMLRRNGFDLLREIDTTMDEESGEVVYTQAPAPEKQDDTVSQDPEPLQA